MKKQWNLFMVALKTHHHQNQIIHFTLIQEECAHPKIGLKWPAFSNPFWRAKRRCDISGWPASRVSRIGCVSAKFRVSKLSISNFCHQLLFSIQYHVCRLFALRVRHKDHTRNCQVRTCVVTSLAQCGMRKHLRQVNVRLDSCANSGKHDHNTPHTERCPS